MLGLCLDYQSLLLLLSGDRTSLKTIVVVIDPFHIHLQDPKIVCITQVKERFNINNRFNTNSSLTSTNNIFKSKYLHISLRICMYTLIKKN